MPIDDPRVSGPATPSETAGPTESAGPGEAANPSETPIESGTRDHTLPARTAQPPPGELPFGPSGHPRRWAILGALVFCVLIAGLDLNVMILALPTLQRDLHASPSQLLWSMDAYTLALAALLFSWGVLGDRYGRKRILLCGLTVFGVGSALAAFAGSPEQLIAFRAMMGIGGAALMPISLAFITVVFPPNERGKAIGAWAGTTGGAMMLGPVLSGLLLQHPSWYHGLTGNDWGVIFLINIPIIVVALILVTRIVPETRNPRPRALDAGGLLLSVVGLILLVYGIIHAGDTRDWGTASVLVPIAAGIAVLALFVVVEARSGHPSFDLAVFRRRHYTVALLGIVLTYLVFTGVAFSLPFYMQVVQGLRLFPAGLTFLPLAVVQMIAAPASGPLVIRFGERAVLAAGLTLLAGSMAATAAFRSATPMWLILLVFAAYGLGAGMGIPPASTVMQNCLPPDRVAAGGAIQATAPQVAGVLGVAVLGTVLFNRYADTLTPRLDRLPPVVPAGTRSVLTDSISNVRPVLGALQRARVPDGLLDRIRADAFTAYCQALELVSLIATAVVLIAAATVLVGLPRRIHD